MPDKKLKIMGDDNTEEAQRLKKYCQENKIKNIKFLGFKSGKELDKVISHCRYVIIPSIWYDNLPNTALEAFKHSKAIIASNIGSLPELVIDNVNGLLFEPGNYEDLIVKIKKIDNEKLLTKFGKESQKLLTQKFSEQQHYENLIEIFNKLVKEGK